MSKAMVKTDDDALASIAQEPLPTEKEAQKALESLGVGSIKILSWTNETILGRYMAKGIAGHVLSKSVIREADADNILNAMKEIVVGEIKNDGSPEAIAAALTTKIQAAAAWTQLNKSLNEGALMQIRMADISARGMKKDKSKTFAPQAMTVIGHQTVDNRQVIVEKKASEE